MNDVCKLQIYLSGFFIMFHPVPKYKKIIPTARKLQDLSRGDEVPA